MLSGARYIILNDNLLIVIKIKNMTCSIIFALFIYCVYVNLLIYCVGILCKL